MQTGQSYGRKYEDLATRLPQNSVVESMCAADFSNVLSQISQFVVSQAEKSYVVTGLNTGEIILSVAVKRNSQLISLTNSQYEIVGNTITLTNYTLLSGDTLEISIGKN